MTNNQHLSAERLNALAELCEKASGPDRELDCLIAVEALGYIAEPPKYEGGPIRYCRQVGDQYEMPGQGGDMLVRDYTASLDAALTLVPEGWTWSAGCSQYVPHQARVHLSWGYGGSDGHSDYSHALALCAAALRSRASQAAKIEKDEVK